MGDIHLGRRPGGLPDDLADSSDRGLSPAELTPAAAWHATVRFAIASQIDAVVLAGDVVESVDDRFEAHGHLASGVRALIDAGIAVYGVAGNHDVQALPRLAAQIPDFRLLGQGGRWEVAQLAASAENARDAASADGDRGPSVALVGWSFPSAVVTRDPVAELNDEVLGRAAPGSTLLGVLHCDVDGGASRYAPVSRRALETSGVDGWLLGHIHRPSLEPVPLDTRAASHGRAPIQPIGYLGSLSALDPGESGVRGPWLVEVSQAGRIALQQQPLAPLRFERVGLDLAQLDLEVAPDGGVSGSLDADDGPRVDAGVDSQAEVRDLEDRLFAALRGCLARVRDRVANDAGGVRAVGCRVRLEGRCREHGAVVRWLEARRRDGGSALPRETFDGIHFFVEKVEDRGAPAVDLERLAAGGDPPALLARRLLVLERGGPEADRLLEAAGRRLSAAMSRGVDYTQLISTHAIETDALGGASEGVDRIDRERVRETLTRAATRALDELLAQRGASLRDAPDAGRSRLLR